MVLSRIILSGKNPSSDAVFAGEVYGRIAYNISYPEGKYFLTKEPTKEIKFVYEYFKLDLPEPISQAKIGSETEFILVGHNKPSQIIDVVDLNRVVAVVDNHSVDFRSENQIYFRSEPVGSTCTVLTEMLLEHAQIIPVEVAKLLIAGIISETYLFTAPLTKAIDRQMVDRLNKIAQIINIQVFAEKLFEEKADIVGLEIADVVGEPVRYDINGKKVCLRQIFTPRPEKTLERKIDFVSFLKSEKEEISILAVTDIVNKSTYFLVPNEESMKIVDESMMFGEKVDENQYNMQGVSSVSQEILPAIESVFS